MLVFPISISGMPAFGHDCPFISSCVLGYLMWFFGRKKTPTELIKLYMDTEVFKRDHGLLPPSTNIFDLVLNKGEELLACEKMVAVLASELIRSHESDQNVYAVVAGLPRALENRKNKNLIRGAAYFGMLKADMPEYYDSRERVSDLEWIARSSFASALIETLGNMIKYYKEANLSEESNSKIQVTRATTNTP